MEDIENLSDEDKRHYVMSSFREQYPVALNLLARMNTETSMRMDAQEIVAIVRSLSIACLEYQRYVEEHPVDISELH